MYDLLQVSQHALQVKQLLQLQVHQLQKDKDQLQQEVDQLIRDRDAAESQLLYKHRHTPLTTTLEETQWEVQSHQNSYYYYYQNNNQHHIRSRDPQGPNALHYGTSRWPVVAKLCRMLKRPQVNIPCSMMLAQC